MLVALCVVGWWLATDGPPTPGDDEAALGIDVSHHQGPIDWSAVETAGVRFAWMKATEGGDWQDPRFAANWAAAGGTGVLRGAYHFFTFCTPGLEQARNFIAHVPREAGTLPPAIDLEFAGNCSQTPGRGELREELDAFIEAVALHYGRDPVLYVTPTSYWTYVAGAGLGLDLWRRSIAEPPRWPVWQPYTVWQYADDGTVAGITGDVDLNVFAGGRAELEAWVE